MSLSFYQELKFKIPPYIKYFQEAIGFKRCSGRCRNVVASVKFCKLSSKIKPFLRLRSEASLSCDRFITDNVAKERSWPNYKSLLKNIYDLL